MNPSPSSPRYSRIIRLIIAKETRESLYQFIEEKIANLQPTKILLGDKCYIFTHRSMCTLMDGRTCNILMGTTSLQECKVCHATPK